MANIDHHLSLLLLIIILLLPTLITSSASPPPPIEERRQQQLNNIINALIGADDFNSLAKILSTADFPLSTTLFIPSDDSLFSSDQLNPYIIPYHVVPQRLSFSELCLLKPFSHLPTLLPGESILITNNSPSNFTLDNTLLFSPDVYLTSTLAVHGIATVLDLSLYGGGGGAHGSKSPPGIFLPPSTGDVDIGGRGGGGRRSDAACWCREFPVLFSVICAVLTIKIYRYPLGR